MLIFFTFDNDDMELSKRRVTFLSLSFLLIEMTIFPVRKLSDLARLI